MTSLSNVDEYGFERAETVDSSEYERFLSGYLRVLARRSAKWRQLVGGKGQQLVSKSAKLKRFIRKGVPSEYRTKVWLATSGGGELLADNPGRYRDLLQGPFSQSALDDIAADLPRTCPDNIHFRSETSPARRSLANVLRAFSKYSPRVGYCQGVNYIAALLLLVTDSEEKTFWILAALVDRLVPDYYTPSMKGVRVDIDVLSQLVRSKMPALYEHMEMLGVAWSMVATKWLVCLFADVLPVETTLRVWDCMFYEGTKVLFRVALSLLRLHETKLLDCRDFMTFMTECRSVGRSFHVLDCHQFMQDIFKSSNPLPASKMTLLRDKSIQELQKQEVKIKSL